MKDLKAYADFVRLASAMNEARIAAGVPINVALASIAAAMEAQEIEFPSGTESQQESNEKKN